MVKYKCKNQSKYMCEVQTTIKCESLEHFLSKKFVCFDEIV